MNPEVIRARRTSRSTRSGLGSSTNPPRLDALLTVVYRRRRRAAGRRRCRPSALLPAAPGRSRPTTSRQDAAVARVVDAFALHDVLAVPVVGARRAASAE